MIRNIAHRGPGWRRAFALAATGMLIGAVILIGSSVLIASAAAPITSANLSPTANHAPNGWTNPGNAWDGDGTNYATATQNSDQGYSSFNLPAVPDGSIITGIRVTAVAKVTDADCDLGVSLSWNNGSNTTTRQDQSLGTNDTTVTFGGVPGSTGNNGDTFGRVWSPSELTNGNFVAIVRSVDTGSSCSGSATTSLKSIQVAVAYRPGTAGTANPAIVPGQVCGQADFNFVVDTSGSIGSTNMATVRSQLQAFANTYQTGGDGLYSLTSFSSAASTRTAGFVNAATFNTAASNLPASNGRTYTSGGISTGAGNNANDRAGVPNIMFVLTDGSPNVTTSGVEPSLTLPQTWQDAADAAIGAANSARGSYVVNAVFVGTGDTSLPFTSAYDAAYTSFVMTQIGGGGYSSISDFGNIANGLLDLLGCRNIVVTKVTDLHQSDTTFTGSISNAQDNNVPAAWSVTSVASNSTTRTSDTVFVARNHAHTVTEDAVPAGWTLKGWYGPISTTALCPTDPAQYSGTSIVIPSGTSDQQVCVFNSFAANPALTLDKTTSTANYDSVGDVISYSYLLTNSGNVSLVAPYSVSDNKATVTCPQTPSPLVPGGTITCTATYVVTQADLNAGSVINLATGQATFNGQPVNSNQDSVTVPGVQTPQLTLDKTTSTANYDSVGDVISYSYLLTNSGNVSLVAPYSVSDNKATVTCPQTPSPLVPGGTITCTATYVVTQADLNAGSVINLATGQATFNGQPVNSNQDSVTVPGVQTPQLTLDKTTSTANYDSVGDVISYSYLLTNSGNVSLVAPYSVSDNKATVTCPQTPSPLVPGGTITCTATYVVTQADLNAGSVINLATGQATFNGQPVNSNQDSVTVPGVQTPQLTLDKTTSTANYDSVGDVISYSYLLTNSGNVSLVAPYSVSDNKATVTCPQTPSPLVPGGTITCTATYVVTQADLNAGSVINLATGQATFNGQPVNSNQDSVTVPGVQTPQLTLDKTTSTANYDSVGDVISYSYLLTNSGNVSLVAPYSVSDNKATVTCPQTPSPLVPGGTITCTATYVVTQADLNAGSVINLATGQATFNGQPVNSNQDSVTVPGVQRPAISITKGVSLFAIGPWGPSETVAVGSTVYYRVVVTNTGNVTLTGVTLTDDVVPGLGGCAVPATLVPNDSFTCDYTDTVVLGTTVNTATADAVQVDPVEDTASVLGVQPNLDVVKTVDKTTAQPGDVLTYTITLTNNGTADATGVDILDDVSVLTPYGTISDVSPAATGPGNLEWAGQTIPADGNPYAYSFKLTLNSSGWQAGDTFVKNTVVVSGTPNPCAQPDVAGVPPWGTATVVTTASKLTIKKTVNPTQMIAGSAAATTYTIVVRNEGDGATAGPVVVTDVGMPPFFSPSSITCTSDPGNLNIPGPTCDYGDLVSEPKSTSGRWRPASPSRSRSRVSSHPAGPVRAPTSRTPAPAKSPPRRSSAPAA